MLADSTWSVRAAVRPPFVRFHTPSVNAVVDVSFWGLGIGIIASDD
ncbi:MAG: hypothetical protein GY788_05400 [bacterium]|nr:hypothetical protein [bacterium]